MSMSILRLRPSALTDYNGVLHECSLLLEQAIEVYAFSPIFIFNPTKMILAGSTVSLSVHVFPVCGLDVS